jgi:hypothetical protein
MQTASSRIPSPSSLWTNRLCLTHAQCGSSSLLHVFLAGISLDPFVNQSQEFLSSKWQGPSSERISYDRSCGEHRGVGLLHLDPTAWYLRSQRLQEILALPMSWFPSKDGMVLKNQSLVATSLCNFARLWGTTSSQCRLDGGGRFGR